MEESQLSLCVEGSDQGDQLKEELIKNKTFIDKCCIEPLSQEKHKVLLCARL